MPKYLPSTEKIDVNPHGSYVRIFFKNNTEVSGELIAIDTSNIVVLTSHSKICVTVPVSAVKRFSLRYAKPKNHSWTIFAFTSFTVAHGYFLIYTAPLNFIVTSAVTLSGAQAYRYNHRNMTYDKMRMFARFPQGIPENIDMESIK